ncbi:hypothetical protein SAMN04488540_1341 [Ferrimonas sediminum]|uniref:Uncharacterized protein n=1 Tax=Ferrimonas sediminum TaxID=718193 RepID=A0A1G9BRG6_9GAMM|nr:hypothetical protein [Ferrimonas sediminum]SDK42052.1 hypothetical protein SAMN04488540_1341 [Ferrimonas sediminum]
MTPVIIEFHPDQRPTLEHALEQLRQALLQHHSHPDTNHYQFVVAGDHHSVSDGADTLFTALAAHKALHPLLQRYLEAVNRHNYFCGPKQALSFADNQQWAARLMTQLTPLGVVTPALLCDAIASGVRGREQDFTQAMHTLLAGSDDPRLYAQLSACLLSLPADGCPPTLSPPPRSLHDPLDDLAFVNHFLRLYAAHTLRHRLVDHWQNHERGLVNLNPDSVVHQVEAQMDQTQGDQLARLTRMLTDEISHDVATEIRAIFKGVIKPATAVLWPA